MADRFAEAMVTRKYSDSLVQGYVSSLARIMQEIRIRVDWGSEKMP